MKFNRLHLFHIPLGLLMFSCGSSATVASTTSTTATDSLSIACSSVEGTIRKSYKTISDFTQNAATRVEAIAALGDMADALDSAATNLTSSNKEVFQDIALVLNQLRVAQLNESTVPESLWSALDTGFSDLDALCLFDQ
jgi:uncharacterized protein YfiM (DUF2279 family)